MENQKPLEFNATAGSYFVTFLVTLIATYIPFFGWAFSFNYLNNWAAENSLVNGKKITYTAGYGEALKFIFVNVLLMIITLGIYSFWFVPKSYKFAVDHVSYEGAPVAKPAPVSPAPISPAAPTLPPTVQG